MNLTAEAINTAASDLPHWSAARATYDLVVIGGHAAALAASEAARLGGRIALSYWQGATGSSHASDLRRRVIAAGRRGPDAARALLTTDTAERQDSQNKSDVRLLEELRKADVAVREGHAVFTGPNSVAASGEEILFQRAILALEDRPALPTIEGLAEAKPILASQLDELARWPRSVAVLGDGGAALETAQALSRAGCETHLASTGGELLAGIDARAAEALIERLRREGLHIHAGIATKCETIGVAKAIRFDGPAGSGKLIVGEIIVADGFAPAGDRMGLPAAKVDVIEGKIAIDSRLRTSNPRVFSLPSGEQARGCANSLVGMCVRNALLSGGMRFSASSVRWIATDPAIAQIGVVSHPGDRLVDTYEAGDLNHVLESRDDAVWASVNCRKGTGRIVGATIIGSGAAELIGQISLSIERKISLRALAELPAADCPGQRALAAAARQCVAARRDQAATGQRWFSWSRTQ